MLGKLAGNAFVLVSLFCLTLSAHGATELKLEDLITGNKDFDQAVEKWLSGTSEKIVGGKEAPIDKFPWQASIGVSFIFDPFSAQYCAGAVYNEQWILTAAHCVNGLSPSKISITVGYNDLTKVHKRYNVKTIMVHKDYLSPKKGQDIALLELLEPLKFSKSVKRVKIDDGSAMLTSASLFSVAGWGQTTDQLGSKSATLRFIEDLPLVSRDDCNLPLAYDGKVSDSMICAGFPGGKLDPCKGDSGGALTRVVNGETLQTGITSWGESCAKPMKYGVYTLVSVYTDWIKKCVSNNATCYSK